MSLPNSVTLFISVKVLSLKKRDENTHIRMACIKISYVE
jgi:hypothetical protein